MIEKHVVSRGDSIYEAFPDVALAPSGRLVCVLSECTHHRDRGYTRIAVTHSDDRGRTWSPKRALTEALQGDPQVDPWWNCPRVSTLGDGRLVAVVERIRGRGALKYRTENLLWLSEDEGASWEGPVATPVRVSAPMFLIVDSTENVCPVDTRGCCAAITYAICTWIAGAPTTAIESVRSTASATGSPFWRPSSSKRRA